MNTINSFGDTLYASFINTFNIFMMYVPRILGALIILIIGFIIASIVGSLVRRLIHMTRVDEFLNNTQIRNRIHFPISISRIVGSIAKWFIILMTLLAVSDSLGLPQVNVFINQILLYIPNVVAALIMLAIGGIASELLDEVVVTALSASQMKPQFKKTLGSITRYAVLIFSVLAALTQLKVVPQLIQIFFAGLVFAMSLAVGLGAKDHVNAWIAEMKK